MTVTPILSLPPLPLFLAAKRQAENDCKKVAIIDTSRDESFTYTQLLCDVACLKAKLLEESALEDLKEERVAFLAPSGYDHVVCQWAIWAAGGICVPLCTTHPLKELVYTLSDSDPLLIILHPSFNYLEEELNECCPNTTFMHLSLIVTSKEESLTLPLFNSHFDMSRRALMIYTSGTTASPKGCISTHNNIDFQSKCLVEAWKYSPSDHLIHVLPLHHIHGIINGLTATLMSGATVEMYTKFDPGAVWKKWSEIGGSTMFMAVPTVYARLVDHFDMHIKSRDREYAARTGVASLRLLVSGSAALPAPIKQRFYEISNQILLERYGMTEIGMGLSCGLEPDKRIDGSVGWPLPGVQVRLTDPDTGSMISPGSEKDGMIEITGPNVFLEYWRRPEATQKEFTPDGWFKTGDVARVEKNGAYFIQGRASVDVIKSGGYKISALEVERKMLALDCIQEVAVVGLPDQEWGQRVAAIVKQNGTQPLELKSLRTKLKAEMAHYKVPTVLRVVDNIERNAMGKVNKKDLARKYWPTIDT
ncbi:hypothetical protein LOZ65_001571 [Ophidiomyces ophidiicola]|nr:hypothetical protein LOZ65_001571 [Ophidiomyces ophidiicola]